jgi:hypothetical protein
MKKIYNAGLLRQSKNIGKHKMYVFISSHRILLSFGFFQIPGTN